jgi:hypothetical protein
MRFKALGFAAGLCAAWAAAGVVSAATLPDAQGTALGIPFGPAGGNEMNIGSGFGWAFGQFQPNVELRASAGSYGAGTTSTADATLSYWFMLQGPSDAQIEFSSGLLASASEDGVRPDRGSLAYAGYSVQVLGDPAQQLLQDEVSASAWGADRYRDRIFVTVPVDTPLLIQVWAHAESYGSAGAVGLVYPYLQLGPDVQGTSRYHLLFSPGVVNGSPPRSVPEPSEWALLLIGFAGIGALGRRRRTHGAGLPGHRVGGFC